MWGRAEQHAASSRTARDSDSLTSLNVALTLLFGGRRLASLGRQWGIGWHFTQGEPQGARMGATKILGIVLLVAGLLGLFYGHFEYTKETHEGQFGPFRFSVAEKETAVIPSWASLGVIVAGVVLLVINRK
jgi:hypothetical protein